MIYEARFRVDELADIFRRRGSGEDVCCGKSSEAGRYQLQLGITTEQPPDEGLGLPLRHVNRVVHACYSVDSQATSLLLPSDGA